MEFERNAVNSAKTILRLEVKCDQLQQEIIDLREEVMHAKGKEEEMKEKYVKVKERFELEERKWREEEEKITDICLQLEGENKKLEIDLKTATSRREDVEKKLKASEAEVEALINWLEEKDGRITTLLAKNELLTQKIQVLDRGKRQIEAEFRKVKEENRSKAERIFVIEKVRETEKRAMEDEGKKGVLELICRIEVLEREKRELEAKFFRVNREKNEVTKRILNEKATVEAESKKKVLGLAQRIEILEREKRENEAEVCHSDKEKSEEINRSLNEKKVMEVEKTTMEAESKMNSCVVKSVKNVELPQQMHPASNVGILNSPTSQHQGPKSIDVYISGQKEGSDGGMQLRRMLGSEIQKRKAEGLGCSVSNEAGMKRCKLDGVKECKLTWKSREDMFDAFTDSDELCMKAVCALYRKYRCMGDWKNRLISTSFRGFKPPYETRGMALGELLTSGDPEGKLKKSLPEFEQADSRGLEDCRLIVRHHYVQLLQMYMSNLDPLFISGDDTS